jgi:hypothetical protein
MTFTQFLARVRPSVTRNNSSHFIRLLCHRSRTQADREIRNGESNSTAYHFAAVAVQWTASVNAYQMYVLGSSIVVDDGGEGGGGER